jgi:hypothetical protein
MNPQEEYAYTVETVTPQTVLYSSKCVQRIVSKRYKKYVSLIVLRKFNLITRKRFRKQMRQLNRMSPKEDIIEVIDFK